MPIRILDCAPMSPRFPRWHIGGICLLDEWVELAYDRCDFAHGPQWVFYDLPDCEWLGLEAICLQLIG